MCRDQNIKCRLLTQKNFRYLIYETLIQRDLKREILKWRSTLCPYRITNSLRNLIILVKWGDMSLWNWGPLFSPTWYMSECGKGCNDNDSRNRKDSREICPPQISHGLGNLTHLSLLNVRVSPSDGGVRIFQSPPSHPECAPTSNSLRTNVPLLLHRNVWVCAYDPFTPLLDSSTHNHNGQFF